MFYRDQRINEAQVADRQKQLTWAKLTVYSVACVTHAQQVIAHELAGESHLHFSTINRLITRFWQNYPSSLQPTISASLVEEGEQLLPMEGGASELAWEDDMIWGLVYAFSVVGRQRLSEDVFNAAFTAAERAYWSVFDFFHRDVIHTDVNQIRSVEVSSKICASEIDFQLKLLELLEVSPDPPPTYADLVLQMSDNHRT